MNENDRSAIIHSFIHSFIAAAHLLAFKSQPIDGDQFLETLGISTDCSHMRSSITCRELGIPMFDNCSCLVERLERLFHIQKLDLLD